VKGEEAVIGGVWARADAFERYSAELFGMRHSKTKLLKK
jgi:hypothetical protein